MLKTSYLLAAIDPTLTTVLLIALPIVAAVITGIICGVVAHKKGVKTGYELRKKEAEALIGSVEEERDRIIAEASREGENKKREWLLSAKEEIHRSRIDLEREIKDRRNEIQKNENRILQKEESLDSKMETVNAKESELNKKKEELAQRETKIEEIIQQQNTELERISSMSKEEAKEILLSNMDKELQHEKVALLKDYEQKLKEESSAKAKDIISTAIQKCASDYVSETTVSVVALPNDDMKGRIIGREGRNIRALETLTGVDLIIDDTPEAVILSGFDPIRREVARIALEKLIVDGRIHPARIEEIVEKAKKEVDEVIRQAGENATYESGVFGLHPEIVKLLGRLKFRTSYGQNVLQHSLEVSRLCGVMAAELGEDINLAKRAGLVHDIGKAIDYEVEGSHVTIGADLAKKYKEPPEVINAIMAHHGDVEPTNVISVLVQAADSISAARPGARRETLESYIKRLESLEAIANSFSGVERTYALQAGREIRIMVKPENVNDEEMTLKAREICQKIEEEMEYPGQIKVTIIRETRAVDYAK
ncbi:MAG: ribonuclease Y [Clostridia bacterium]|nr:ribonuclease Y [Clostridia bacterium]